MAHWTDINAQIPTTSIATKCEQSGCTKLAEPSKRLCAYHLRKQREEVRGLAAKIRRYAETCDPFDVVQPLATQAALLQEYVERFAEGIAPTARDIDNMQRWTAQHIASVTRVIDARNQSALTAHEIGLVQAAMAEIAQEFVAEERRDEYFSAIAERLAGWGAKGL